MSSILARVLAGLWWLAVCCATARAQQPSPPAVLFDFESALGRSWSAAGDIRASAEPIPQAAEGSSPLPGGRAVQIEAGAGGRIFTLPGKSPADWLRFEELAFWVFRPPEEGDKPCTLEVALVEADGVASFWRRVDLDHHGWARLALPLSWFRQGEGRVARWDRIDRLQFRFRNSGRLWIDTIHVQEGMAPRAAEPDAGDLAALAFPVAKPHEVRTLAREHLLLLTDAAELDPQRLADHLARVNEAVFADLPFLEKPATPPCLIVFATRQQYQAFTPALAKKLNGQAAAPSGGGFTVQGIATSSWDAKAGSLRPVYTHEYIHSLLERTARLPNRGEWLQEGLAAYYQLKFHPQDNLPLLVAEGVADPEKHLPLKELTSGRTIPLNRYWQAVTLVDMFLATPRGRDQLAALVEAFQKAGGCDLAPHLETVLETTWDDLDAAWKKHCREAFLRR